ncbi:MAG: division/cell wall cluster transcriptional repressor MraZ [Chloroflexales bacterium]
MMLIGTWKHEIETPGCLRLPSALHALLADGLVVTRGFEPCLQVFPRDAWRALAGRVSALPISGAAERRLRRLLFSAACRLSDEGDGFVHLPPQLCSYAALTDHAVIIGMDTYLEIWAPERWTTLVAKMSGAVNGWPDTAIGMGDAAI